MRKEFERITESTYEGDFTKYENGDYVNEIQQYQWEGFQAGYQAATAEAEKYREALEFYANEDNYDDNCAPFFEDMAEGHNITQVDLGRTAKQALQKD